MRWCRIAVGAIVGGIALRAAALAVEVDALAAPVRCVFEYLEAVIAAAPPHALGEASSSDPNGADPRWSRVRSYLAPRAADALARSPRKEGALAPWRALGRDGAFLGFEVLAARRAPRGAAVVIARERSARAPGAPTSTATCAYLVARLAGAWRIADKRCGHDFANREVFSGYVGFWDEPDVRSKPSYPDEPFDGDLE